MNTSFLHIDVSESSLIAIIGIIIAAFISEDLTCIGVGLLLASGKLDWIDGLVGCFLGIILGDFGVWLIGRIAGSRILHWRIFKGVLTSSKLKTFSDRLCNRSPQMAILSRFVPGSRVPLFLTAGIIGTCPYRFLSWGLIAALIWTPVFVISIAMIGESAADFGKMGFPLIAMGLFAATRIFPKLCTPIGRAKLSASIAKLWRWEFWPGWLFYLPLVPWYLVLSIRYRSFTVWTAANPGIPSGGVVGESKSAILARLPQESIIPTALIATGDLPTRHLQIQNAIRESGWKFPLIFKPEAGQRGAGVKIIHQESDIERYLLSSRDAIVIQPYHPGPFEAGVFYYRDPDDENGRIFSITDKVFPVIRGDGKSSLEELIWKHPRYRMQANVFLDRHANQVNRVLEKDENLSLAIAGNHCQGTLFRDGEYLKSPELERDIDAIAKKFDGFYVGRFDIRYENPEEFRNGKGLAIIELNGATSESTNLYDPSWSLFKAYSTLFRQWAILFRIGACNRDRGHHPVGLKELLLLVYRYYRDRDIETLAD